MSDRDLGGRPPFRPTGEQRRTVEVLSAHGIPRRIIAKTIRHR
jgi:hypothetical protein